MTNLDSIFKSRDMTLPTKVRLVKAMVFPVVMYGCFFDDPTDVGNLISGSSAFSKSSLNISPSNEHPGLISFKMDWLDLLAVQGTLKSLLQHHSSKTSILWCSAFFIVQLSHQYMTIALTRRTFVGKVMSLLFHMLSQIRSDQISRSVVSDSLQPHDSQHARPPCPSPTPGVHSDSRPSSQ